MLDRIKDEDYKGSEWEVNIKTEKKLQTLT